MTEPHKHRCERKPGMGTIAVRSMGPHFSPQRLSASTRHVPLMCHHALLSLHSLEPTIMPRAVSDGHCHSLIGLNAYCSPYKSSPSTGYRLVLGLSFYVYSYCSSCVLCSTCPRFPFASMLTESCCTCIYSSTLAVSGPHFNLLSYWAR